MAPAKTDNSPSNDPSWNGAVITRHGWYVSLKDYCHKYHTLWTYGFIITKNKVLTLSDAHSYHIYTNTVKAHSFEKPYDITTTAVPLVEGTTAYKASDDLSKIPPRFEVNPEAIAEACEDLFILIVGTVTSTNRIRDLRKECRRLTPTVLRFACSTTSITIGALGCTSRQATWTSVA